MKSRKFLFSSLMLCAAAAFLSGSALAEENADVLLEAREIITRPFAYGPKEVFEQYASTVETVQVFNNMLHIPIPDEISFLVDIIPELRSQLVQTTNDVDEGIYYIWGDEMPVDETVEYDFTDAVDNAGFRPFLVPYLLENQDEAKGNVIVIAGGGSSIRCNATEGYPVAEYFNTIGYNAYVLQRRVEPYSVADGAMDLQRAVRYLRHNSEELGIKATDKMISIGFSGGGTTIATAINSFYGDILPSATYANYTPDETDAENSDLQIAVLGYGTTTLDTENPNLPPTFLVAGQLDDYTADERCVAYYLALKEKEIHAELHIFSATPHGFILGAGRLPSNLGGNSMNGVKEWPTLLEAFLDIELGYIPRVETIQ